MRLPDYKLICQPEEVVSKYHHRKYHLMMIKFLHKNLRDGMHPHIQVSNYSFIMLKRRSRTNPITLPSHLTRTPHMKSQTVHSGRSILRMRMVTKWAQMPSLISKSLRNFTYLNTTALQTMRTPRPSLGLPPRWGLAITIVTKRS